LRDAGFGTIRAFIAVKMPAETMAAITDVQDLLRSQRLNIKWVRPQSIHLTLKFLGNISPEIVPQISEVIAKVATGEQPIDLAAKGIGVFPTIRRPRVLWIGLSGETAALLALQQKLEEALIPIGFAKEKRSFKAHLTIGRIKGRVDPKELMAAMEPFLDFKGPGFFASGMTLYQSDLKPTGAVYTPLVESAFSADQH
jgi:2'-5' RNA ligase